MSPNRASTSVKRVHLVGNHLPRHCGIATFTTDLADAISANVAGIDCAVVAMNDAEKRYAYPDRVRFEIGQSNLAAYRRAADFMNISSVDILCLQHEYGIFGGKAGSHILKLLNDVRMPIVTTLHTILEEPSEEQRYVMDELVRLSSSLVVMSEHGGELLREVHAVPAEKIVLIPHGIPQLPERTLSRKHLDFEDTTLLLTFGLLSPDKGLEYVIEALPAIVERHPHVVYSIVGVTHPHVKEWHGETYRRSLELLAHKLGVKEHVVFHDRFVSVSELAEFLSAADIYITPYLNMEQITSGTLAYALGNGKPVISTPYKYARELLADDRGVLVPPKDSAALTEALDKLIGDPQELSALSARAAAFGADMTWPAVAKKYVALFERTHRDSQTRRSSFFAAQRTTSQPLAPPELKLDHLRNMTDDTGLLQHARFSVPHYEDG